MYPWQASLPRGRKCEKEHSAAGEHRAKENEDHNLHKHLDIFFCDCFFESTVVQCCYFRPNHETQNIRYVPGVAFTRAPHGGRQFILDFCLCMFPFALVLV